MALVSAGRSRLSPLARRNDGALEAPSRNRSWPVDMSSHPTTPTPSASRRSTRFEPMKPAAPVTNTVFMDEGRPGLAHERRGAWLEHEADAQIVEYEGKEGQRE